MRITTRLISNSVLTKGFNSYKNLAVPVITIGSRFINYSIKQMEQPEIDVLFNWTKSEGWNPGVGELESFNAVDPSGFRMLSINSQAISSLAAVRYPNSYAFLGLYIVKPEFRGQGQGKCLWDYSLNTLSSFKSVGLNGVLSQVNNYEKSGFKISHLNTRWQAGLFEFNDPLPSSDPSLKISEEVSLEEISDLDFHASACYRPSFWESTLARPNSYFLAARENSVLKGFAVLSKCIDGYKLGPVYSSNPIMAEGLLTKLWHKAQDLGGSVSDTIQIDAPGTNPHAAELAKKYGFKEVFDVARMYRGEKPDADDSKTYGLVSLEIG